MSYATLVPSSGATAIARVMVFSSLIFVFLFFPLYLLAYRLAPERHRNPVLLVSSLIFYGWGGPQYLVLLVGETFIAWVFALLMGPNRRGARPRWPLVTACALLLGLLAYFKYWGWLSGMTLALFDLPVFLPEVLLPIGISFYTFQLISYVADVWKGEVEVQRAFWKLLLYSSLFYQCIAGPIVRYETVATEIDRRHASRTDVYLGLRRFCVGLAKKAVLANGCASVADTLLPIGSEALATQAVTGYWLGMAFYMLQIYLDFSAYSDMAIGMGRMVGFHFLENFDYPYISRSIREFWHRWHISLSTFFRDYVYFPLGGSRCSTAKTIRNLTVVWLLTGLWHGASWNYVLWGLYFLAFLLLERYVLRGIGESWAGLPYALIVVFFGWVLFRFESFAELGTVVAGLFGATAGGFSSLEVQTIFTEHLFLLIVSIVACTRLPHRLRGALARIGRGGGLGVQLLGLEEFVVPVFTLIISVAALAGASYNPFIYFQF